MHTRKALMWNIETRWDCVRQNGGQGSIKLGELVQGTRLVSSEEGNAGLHGKVTGFGWKKDRGGGGGTGGGTPLVK